MATLLEIHSLTKTYGPHVVLDEASLTIAEKQKIGVIGRNGAGKSTLFNIIVGHEEETSGAIVIHDIARIGYLAQQDTFGQQETVMEYLLRSSQKEEWECAKMAGQFQLKHEVLHTPISSLAGGYQMRVKLTGVLLNDPNLLLLDEPTNYLDVSTQLLLEQFLRQYRGSFLIISHDREFLKNTCEQTLEIDRGKTTLYPAPLEEYFAYKQEQIDFAKRYNKKIEREKRHLQSFVDRFRYKASKATQAQSKIKQIEKLKTIDIEHPMSTTRIRIPRVEERKGIALRVNNLTIGYPEKIIAPHIMLDIDRGEHVAIVGDNGQGKTTFLKTIAQELSPREGHFRWGVQMKLGYYAQHVPSMLNPLETVKSYLVRKAVPEIKMEGILEMAGNFLFRGDALEKPIGVLSGGEKARLCLAGLLLERNHALLLDEPTNHLDFETVEALAVALKESNSTIFFVSHNRTFVNLVADKIIEVQHGKVRLYPHNYEEYVYHLSLQMQVEPTEEKKIREQKIISNEGRKELHAQIKQYKKELIEVELTLSELEREKQTLFDWIEAHPQDYDRDTYQKMSDIQKIVQEKEEVWMGIQEKMSHIQKLLT